MHIDLLFNPLTATVAIRVQL